MELVAVAAIAENRALGRAGEIPWPSLPADRRQYRERVADSPVILGRRTFQSMLEDLPGRRHLVLSRSLDDIPVDTATIVRSPEEAIDVAERSGAECVYVIGGGRVYESFLPHYDRMILTRVPGRYAADTYFPDWDRTEWECVDETAYENFTVEEWVRR